MTVPCMRTATKLLMNGIQDSLYTNDLRNVDRASICACLRMHGAHSLSSYVKPTGTTAPSLFT